MIRIESLVASSSILIKAQLLYRNTDHRCCNRIVLDKDSSYMSTFGIETISKSEIKIMILSLLPPPGKNLNIRMLIKFDSTFTLNPLKV